MLQPRLRVSCSQPLLSRQHKLLYTIFIDGRLAILKKKISASKERVGYQEMSCQNARSLTEKSPLSLIR